MRHQDKHKTSHITSPGRRALLRHAAVAALGAGGLSGYLAHALAAARVPLHPGMREIKGEVRINNQPARLGQLVRPGDVVATGKDARAVFIIGP